MCHILNNHFTIQYQFQMKFKYLTCDQAPNLKYKFTCLPVCDVMFYCIIIFYVSAAEPAIGKSIFVWNWHPRETRLIFTQLFVRPSVTGRFDPLTVSAMPILQPPKNEPQRPILLRICFFFNLFFGFVFSEKSKATYLLLF